MKNFKTKAAILSAALAFAATSVTQAVPTLRIMSGLDTVTITDNGVGDLDGQAGSIAYSAPAGTFAGWSVVFSGGLSKPVIGSATSPALDLVWSIARSGVAGPGTITAMFSDNDFNLANATPLTVSAGGTLGSLPGNTATVSTFYDANNNVLDTTTLLTTRSFNDSGSMSGDDIGNAPADSAVAFTIVLSLTQNAGQNTSGDIHLYVNAPEGGSMVTFLGTALLALGAFATRRKA